MKSGSRPLVIFGEMVWLVYMSLSISRVVALSSRSTQHRQVEPTSFKYPDIKFQHFDKTYLKIHEAAYGCGTASNSFPGWLE